MTKQCSNCKRELHLEKFGKHKLSKDNLNSQCNECLNIEFKKKSKTKDGVINTLYYSQIQSSRRRGHRSPEYSKQELKEWAFSQTIFHELHREWVISKYDKMLKPSIDRKNDDVHYCFNNIQLMTWGQNKDKQTEHFKRGILNNNGFFSGGLRKVEAINDNGIVVMSFISMAEAARHLGLKSHSNISLCCSGKKNKIRGYKWRYAND